MGKYANFYGSVNGDRVYTASSFCEWLRPFFKNGVFYNELQVKEKNGMEVEVEIGNIHIDGMTKCFDKPTVLTLERGHPTLKRIDSVVVRRVDNERDFIIDIVKGATSANPVPTEPKRTAGVYEYVLAQILVKESAVKITQADIKDTRMDSKICGFVAATVSELDFTQLNAQFDAFFENEKRGFDDYMNREKEEFKKYTEAYKQSRMDAFDKWFEETKGQLDGDTASKLAVRIDDLKTEMNAQAEKVHEFIEEDSKELRQRVDFIEHTLYDKITSNPFKISFENIDGFINFEGIWNEEERRIEI